MNLDKRFAPFQNMFYNLVGNFFKTLARLFGYPANPGMPVEPSMSLQFEMNSRASSFNNLSQHQTFWPPLQHPETLGEMIFGPIPKLNTVPRYFYENNEEGFYNFYIENYKNIYFLPDWISEFLQIQLNICLDITVLETIREILFIGLVMYSQLLIFRITLSWFLSINPYHFPWIYLAGATDWAEELFQGIVPSLLGINITGTVVLGILGITADSLNHLVFTMPFLPSEGEEKKLLINGITKNIITFHYLPILWYRYPIPNEIRKFWYQERPDILEYMQKTYHDLNIKLLPNQILQELKKENYLVMINGHQKIETTNLIDSAVTTVITNNNFFDIYDFSMNLDLITEKFHYFF